MEGFRESGKFDGKEDYLSSIIHIPFWGAFLHKPT
jgi:hypothetical protein